MPLAALTRRRFLGLLAGALPAFRLAAAGPASAGAPRIGIALGAGGANGLAHILMLEALDELGVRPHRIAGSSIGAIIGALYAAGMSGKAIRELVERFLITPDENLVDELLHRDALRWVDFLEIELGQGGLLSSQNFIAFLYETLPHDRFEALQIPLRITAADLRSREQVVLQSGALLPAIKASMALPGVFAPVRLGERLLVDGGTVNPVPYDLLGDDCDIVIAIDVSGERTLPAAEDPGYFETIFNAVKIMQHAIMREKRRYAPPTLYIAPRIVDVRALEFHRAKQVFAQAAPAKRELKRRLGELLPGR
jgi:NTE family protein